MRPPMQFDKMRFEMLNNNVNGEQQEFEEKTTADLQGEESKVNLNLANDLSDVLTLEEKTTADLQGEESDVNLNLASDLSDVLTLEGLRRTFNSCTNCGVSWYDKHISLDCAECGGYAMVRPCPICDGHCGGLWRRDAKASHTSKRAQWNGSCSLLRQGIIESQRDPISIFKFQTGYRPSSTSIPSQLTQNLVNGNQIRL